MKVVKRGYFRQEISRNRNIEEIIYLEGFEVQLEWFDYVLVGYCHNSDTLQTVSKLTLLKKIIYSQGHVGWLGGSAS